MIELTEQAEIKLDLGQNKIESLIKLASSKGAVQMKPKYKIYIIISILWELIIISGNNLFYIYHPDDFPYGLINLNIGAIIYGTTPLGITLAFYFRGRHKQKSKVTDI
ncbi:MAG TPA: hypothetical protein VEU72_05625 [Nitrosopumilaceae archaeon]|nr:hypothetical protein [Nitrosopumilaceae archaeon]